MPHGQSQRTTLPPITMIIQIIIFLAGRAFYYMACVLKRSLLMRNCTHTTTAGKLSKLPLIITIIFTIVIIVIIIVVIIVTMQNMIRPGDFGACGTVPES